MDKKTEYLLQLAEDCSNDWATAHVGESILTILRGEKYERRSNG